MSSANVRLCSFSWFHFHLSDLLWRGKFTLQLMQHDIHLQRDMLEHVSIIPATNSFPENFNRCNDVDWFLTYSNSKWLFICPSWNCQLVILFPFLYSLQRKYKSSEWVLSRPTQGKQKKAKGKRNVSFSISPILPESIAKRYLSSTGEILSHPLAQCFMVVIR